MRQRQRQGLRQCLWQGLGLWLWLWQVLGQSLRQRQGWGLQRVVVVVVAIGRNRFREDVAELLNQRRIGRFITQSQQRRTKAFDTQFRQQPRTEQRALTQTGLAKQDRQGLLTHPPKQFADFQIPTKKEFLGLFRVGA